MTSIDPTFYQLFPPPARKYGISREVVPFILTNQMVKAMNGVQSDLFKKFGDLVARSLLVLRRNVGVLASLFEMVDSKTIQTTLDQ